MVNSQRSINKEEQRVAGTVQHLVIRVAAHFFSILFHPLFIPLYVVGFLIYYHPSYFSGFGNYDKLKLLYTTMLNTVFFPLLSVLLMKGLGFIKSIFLHTQQDRIAPYLSGMIFYFWAAWVYFKFEPGLSLVFPSFMTGIVLTTVVGLISNIYFKISMHAMGVGGMLGIFLVIMKSNSMLMTWPLCIALLISGIACTSRLLISDHSTKEVYGGLLAGLLCQFAAAMILV